MAPRKLYLEMAPYGVWYFIEESEGIRIILCGPHDSFEELMRSVAMYAPELSKLGSTHIRIPLEEKVDIR